MYILRTLAFLFLAQAVLAQQPTPILPDPKLTQGDTFDVTAQDEFKIDFEDGSSATTLPSRSWLVSCPFETRTMQWNISDRSQD